MSLCICFSRTSIEAKTEAVLRSKESFILLSISNFIFWKKLLDSFADFDEQYNTNFYIGISILINKKFKSGNFQPNQDNKIFSVFLIWDYK